MFELKTEICMLMLTARIKHCRLRWWILFLAVGLFALRAWAWTFAGVCEATVVLCVWRLDNWMGCAWARDALCVRVRSLVLAPLLFDFYNPHWRGKRFRSLWWAPFYPLSLINGFLPQEICFTVVNSIFFFNWIGVYVKLMLKKDSCPFQ